MAMPTSLRKRKSKNESLDAYWPEIKEKIDFGLEMRRPFERQWILNLAFLAGNQYVVFNATTHMLQGLGEHGHRDRTVDNIILPKWTRQVSNLIKVRPEMSVVPNSVQEEDIAAAKIGAKACEWYFREVLKKGKLRQLAAWIYSTGNAFLDDVWNRKKGPMGFDEKQGKITYAGDVDCSVWSPFGIVAPTGFECTEINSLPWIAKMRRVELSFIEENWKRGGEVKAEKLSSAYLTLETLINNAIGVTSIGRVPSAQVITLYVQPCKAYPRGGFFVAANGVVLEKEDYPFDMYSVEHFKDIDLPGLFWGDATMSHAIPLQVDWNDDVNSIRRFNKTAAKAKLANPSGSNLTTRFDDEHGEIITYKPVLGHRPDYMTLKSTPPSIDKNMDRVQFSMENLFSQHEVTRGTNRSDIRSGEMVDSLLEQDAMGMVPSFSIFEESLEGHLRRVLRRMAVGYSNERVLKLGETLDDFDVFYFKGADLKNNFDVKIVRQSSLPDSPALRKREILSRYQMGLYGHPSDPRTRRKVMRMLDEKTIDDVFSGEKQDELLAEWENRNMMRGVQRQVNSYDDHVLHLEVHNALRKSIRYHQLQEKHPMFFSKLDAIFAIHCQTHTKFVNESMMKATQQEAMTNGRN